MSLLLTILIDLLYYQLICCYADIPTLYNKKSLEAFNGHDYGDIHLCIYVVTNSQINPI